ncbi:MAG TPA: hypothetical protein VFA07_17445, partial [Chthonomonadaceae bacterium]|nr:hypothetical protein [Chthonomonadaceae bacterium]
MNTRKHLLALSVLIAVGKGVLNIELTRDKVESVVHLDIEAPGTRIELVRPNSDILPNPCYLRVSTPQSVSPLEFDILNWPLSIFRIGPTCLAQIGYPVTGSIQHRRPHGQECQSGTIRA